MPEGSCLIRSMFNPFQEVKSNWNNSRQNSVELDFVTTATIYGLIWVYFFARQERKENSMLQLWNVFPLCTSIRFVAFKQHFKKKVSGAPSLSSPSHSPPPGGTEVPHRPWQAARHESDKVKSMPVWPEPTQHDAFGISFLLKISLNWNHIFNGKNISIK